MNIRRGEEAASPARLLAWILSDEPVAMKAQALPQHLIVMGALALSLFLLALFAASPARAIGEVEDSEPGQVVVKLNPTIDTTIEKVNADYGLTTLDKLPGGDGIYLLEAPAGSDTQGVVGRLVNDARLLYAEPNFVAEAPEDHAGDGRHNAYGMSNTSGYSEDYAASALGLPCAATARPGRELRGCCALRLRGRRPQPHGA